MAESEHGPKRRRRRRRHRLPPGTPPGTLIADPKSQAPTITVIAYSADDIVEDKITNPDQLKNFLDKWPVTWVNIDGLGDVETITKVGEIFSIHRLALEDIMALHQRAKLEQYGDHYFLVLHMLENLKGELQTEQLSIFLGSNFVVTFQDGPLDCMDPARDRLRRKIGRVRGSGPDYLMYSLVDTVIDSYFPLLENYGEQLEDLETSIVASPSRELIAKIHSIKRELLTMRRAIWPLREAINSLLRDVPPLFAEETRLHLRDCYDHTVQIIDFVETYRELGADLMDVYMSSISNRMNEIMKVLTIISTLVGPPTLIAGIYGMNFNPQASPYNMPELNWYYGYPMALMLMALLAICTLGLLMWKGWLGALNPTRNTDIPQ